MGEPADARRRSGRSSQALRDDQPCGPGRAAVVERFEHGAGEAGVLQGDAPIALDEDEQDVLAAQPGQQVGGGGVVLRIRRGGPGELALVTQRDGTRATWA